MVGGIGGPGQLAWLIAQQHAHQAYKAVQKADRDGDDKVSRDEFKGDDKAFNVLDADGDGKITVADFQQMFTPNLTDEETVSQLEELLGGFIKAHDKDGDGFLSLEEFGGDEKEFKRLDRDEDGKLSARELAEDLARDLDVIMAHMYERLLNFDKDEDEPDNLGRIREGLRKQFEEFVKSRDEDGNGKLSADELGEARHLLESLDANDDGELDAEEMTNFFLDAFTGEAALGWADFKMLLLLLSKREDFIPPGSHIDTTT